MDDLGIPCIRKTLQYIEIEFEIIHEGNYVCTHTQNVFALLQYIIETND